ncbi:unnamed protein product [Protopolystoma xenopodis]|uniref:Uncharacterized protein n=1 Tax=Protopolystoma xenopodis TaxID=117903 RepID=A0A3S5B1L4_9PLAT|nr:unnamed protein product [Protopolystoma xenopodis]
MYFTRALPPPVTTTSGASTDTRAYRRGTAWLRLEEVREAAAWLPVGLGGGDEALAITEEDPDRVVHFEQIRPVLLDLGLAEPSYSKTPAEEIQRSRRARSLKRRALLLFLEFLGIYDPVVAEAYDLPKGQNDHRLIFPELTSFVFIAIINKEEIRNNLLDYKGNKNYWNRFMPSP